MKAKITVDIDGVNVATISTDDLTPQSEQAEYQFDYNASAYMLICFILADCIDGIEGIEAKYSECGEVLH